MPPKKSTIFISYVREESDFALKLGQDLRSAGANIWLDTLDIIASQHWDDAIQEALKACESFLIILSPTSVVSDNVKNEFSFALEKNKQIIPVLHKNCEIPLRLHRIQYSDFTQDYDDGFKQLMSAINFQQLGDTPEQTKPDKELIEKPRKPVTEVQKRVPSAEKIKKPQLVEANAKSGQKKQAGFTATQRKKPKFKRILLWTALLSISVIVAMLLVIKMINGEREPITSNVENRRIENFRTDAMTLSEEEVKKMVKEYNFFDNKRNKKSRGIENNYVFETLMNGEKVIVDSSTMLVWQQSGFSDSKFVDAQEKVSKLKKSSGNEWRLPTLEEAMSLMERKKVNNLHIDSLFNPVAESKRIWTADYDGSHAWIVSFTKGHCAKEPKTYLNTGVLAVRSSSPFTSK